MSLATSETPVIIVEQLSARKSLLLTPIREHSLQYQVPCYHPSYSRSLTAAQIMSLATSETPVIIVEQLSTRKSLLLTPIREHSLQYQYPRYHPSYSRSVTAAQRMSLATSETPVIIVEQLSTRKSLLLTPIREHSLQYQYP